MSIWLSLIIATSSLISLAIGYYVYSKRPHQISNQAFTLFTFGIFLWGIGFLFLQKTGNMIFDSIILFGVVIGLIGLVVFSKNIERPRFKKLEIREIIFLSPLVMSILGIPSNWYISEVIISTEGKVIPVNTEWFPFFALGIAFYLGVALINIISLTFHKNAQTQNKGLILLLSLGIFLIISAVANLLLPAFGMFDGNYLGFIAIGVLAFGIAYTVLFERLCNVRLVIQKFIVYMTMLAFVVSIYVLVIYCIGLLMLPSGVNTYLVVAVITTLLSSFSFPIIEKFLRRKTDQWLFHDHYQHDEEFLTLAQIMSNEITPDRIIHAFQNEMTRILKAKQVYFIVADPSTSLLSFTMKSLTYGKNIVVAVHFQGEYLGTIQVKEKRSNQEYSSKDYIFIHSSVQYFATKLWLSLQIQNLSNQVWNNKIQNNNNKTREVTHEEKNQLVTNLAHSLQTPLSMLRSEIEMFSTLNIHKDELIHLRAHELEQHIDKISNFITKIITASKYETTADHLVKTDVGKTLSDIAEYLSTIAQASTINFTYEIQYGHMVYLEPKVFEEMILNVVSNAFKYRRENINHTVSLHLEKHNEHFVKISIKDNGQGIDTSEIPFLYERWYRANKVQNGTGLGLYMVKKGIDAHKGRIRIESTLQEGTQVCIYLPITKENSQN